MIKFPKEVSRVFRKLEENGYRVYAVGGCVRDSLLGNNPIDFDLATNAKLDELKELFPDAIVLSEKLSVIRFDYSNPEDEDEGIILDVATFRVDGQYSDYRRPDSVTFVDNIEEDLGRRDFTINAMADNPSQALVDPFDGQEDLKRKLIRTVGDASERFQEDPVRMLRAIRFASRLDFDLQINVAEAIKENCSLIENVSKDTIRREFEEIMVGLNTGKGLRLLMQLGVMPYIIGEDLANNMKRSEANKLEELIEGIDKTYRVLERRLGVFYECFEKRRAEAAVEFLNYGGKMKQRLIDAIYVAEKLYFVPGKVELKDFLVEYGMDRYEYLHNLAKASRIIYDQYDSRILGRQAMLEEIERNNEPVFVEDLAIDGNDLIEEGIAKGEDVGKILVMLTDMVHRKPYENTRETLLKYARKFSKSKLIAALRKVMWIR